MRALICLSIALTHSLNSRSATCRMPVEHVRLTLKPNNFFNQSPANDVLAETDANSKLAFGTGAKPVDGVAAEHVASANTNGANGTNGVNGTNGSNGTRGGNGASDCHCD